MPLPNGFDYIAAGQWIVRLHEDYPDAYAAFYNSLKKWRQEAADAFIARERVMRVTTPNRASFYPHAIETTRRISEKAHHYYKRCLEQEERC